MLRFSSILKTLACRGVAGRRFVHAFPASPAEAKAQLEANMALYASKYDATKKPLAELKGHEGKYVVISEKILGICDTMAEAETLSEEKGAPFVSALIQRIGADHMAQKVFQSTDVTEESTRPLAPAEQKPLKLEPYTITAPKPEYSEDGRMTVTLKLFRVDDPSKCVLVPFEVATGSAQCFMNAQTEKELQELIGLDYEAVPALIEGYGAKPQWTKGYHFLFENLKGTNKFPIRLYRHLPSPNPRTRYPNLIGLSALKRSRFGFCHLCDGVPF